jgi:hypothetical protein
LAPSSTSAVQQEERRREIPFRSDGASSPFTLAATVSVRSSQSPSIWTRSLLPRSWQPAVGSQSLLPQLVVLHKLEVGGGCILFLSMHNQQRDEVGGVSENTVR